jgi:hypothetical protein
MKACPTDSMEQYGSSLPSCGKILCGTSEGQIPVQLNAVALSPFTPPCKENKYPIFTICQPNQVISSMAHQGQIPSASLNSTQLKQCNKYTGILCKRNGSAFAAS